MAACAGCAGAPLLAEPRAWDFQADDPDGPAAGFVVPLTETGALGRWQIRRDVPGAPSPRYVLGQIATHTTDAAGCLILADTPAVAEVRVRVQATPHDSGPARGFGVVIRYDADGTHYCARWDVAHRRLLLERVVGTTRTVLASAPIDVIDLAAVPWHGLVVAARGQRIAVAFDDVPKIDVRDPAPLGPGQVGLWTPAGAVASFDDLLLEPLDPQTGAPATAPTPAPPGDDG